MFLRKLINNRIVNTKIKVLVNNNGSKWCYSTCIETKVIVKGQTINYLKVGNGSKTVFCLPGAIGTIWSDFKPQIEGLDRNKFTIIAWDPPGYGFSRPPNRNFSETSHQDYAEIAYDFMKQIGISKYIPLGWSDGGVTSMILAANHPEVIEKIVIWGALAYVTHEEVKLYDNMRDISKWSDKVKDPLIEMYSEKGLKELWDGCCNTFNEILKNKKGDICLGKLDNIKCPTLILHGDKDPIVNVTHPTYLNEHINESVLKRFPEGKHNLHLRFAEEFNTIVTDFILK